MTSALLTRSTTRPLFALLTLVLSLTAGVATQAQAAEPYVPPALEPWVSWVLHDHPDLECPRDAASGEPARCAWVTTLAVEVAANARFTMGVRVFAQSRIQLPGNGRLWPREITVNGQSATVVGGATRPAVLLQPGSYSITGTIDWAVRPSALELPEHAGLVALTVDGEAVVRPTRNGNALLLGNSAGGAPTTERDSLSVDVFRLITDNYPLTLDTTLVLSVAGQPRVAELGRVLLDGFELTAFETALPARLNDNGNLEVQIEPGKHRLVIKSRALGSPDRLQPLATTDHWPDQEVWGFLPNRSLRLVSLSGAASIDLSQTAAPFDNETVQGYLLNADSALEFALKQRGTPNPPVNRFSVRRDLWLAFDGSGYRVRDELRADINHASRLSASYALGRVTIDGNDELINTVDGSAPGIELQRGDYQISSVSSIDRAQLALATGWQIDTDSLSATLHLPPGWRLLWATGVDKTPDAWLSRWTLWKIFVLVLLGVLAWRFLSHGFAIVLVLATGLMMHTATSLAVIWLVAVVLLATVRHVEHPGALRFLKIASWSWLGLAVLVATGEAVTHARQAVYPQLEHSLALSSYDADYAPGAADAEIELHSAGNELISDAGTDERRMESLRTKRSEPGRSMAPDRRQNSRLQQQYLEGLQVQTGPGQPAWRWNSARLIWDGPVSEQQTMSVALMPPMVTRTINLLIALLLVGVSALLLVPLLSRDVVARLPAGLSRVVPLLLLAVVVMPVDKVQAAAGGDAGRPVASEAPGVEGVSEDLLKELERRLLATPACFPDCASVQDAAIGVTPDQLTLSLSLHSAELVALPLPTSAIWNPAAITLNGAPATVARNSTGGLELALPAGQHELRMVGPIAHLERFELSFPLNPAAITTEVADAWLLSGNVDGRVARDSLTFARRAATGTQDKTLKPAPAKPFVTIDRTLRFEQEWTLETVVGRRSPERGSFSMDVPLIIGEAVLNNAIAIKDDQAKLVFGRNDPEIRWTSRLTPTNSFTLTAPDSERAAARWTLVPSNFWHLDYSGLNPVAEAAAAAGPTFFPEAGEVLDVQLTPTVPVAGATVTIEQVEHRISVGARQQRHELLMSTLASQGGTLAVTLAQPSDDAGDNELVSVEVNGRQEPISLTDGNRLLLPLTPGTTSYTVTWLENTARGALFEVAQTTLESPASNITTTVSMARDRWVLLLGGPALGPGILYWGLLLVVLLLAVLISRIPGLPFTATDAILLSLGLSLANLPATLLIAVWVIALRFRGEVVGGLTADWSRNLLQIVAAGLSLLTVVTLIVSVPNALLGTPNMQVEGNGSSAYYYNWFTDQTASSLPTAWVLSLPLWVYRVIMLGWSLWLAFALIRWVPWAWQRWAKPQMWYATAKPKGPPGHGR